jgi:hypothetical protein
MSRSRVSWRLGRIRHPAASRGPAAWTVVPLASRRCLVVSARSLVPRVYACLQLVASGWGVPRGRSPPAGPEATETTETSETEAGPSGHGDHGDE